MFNLPQKFKSSHGFEIILLIILITLSYSPSFSVPFLFDDTNHIHHNPRIQNILPFWRPLLGTNRPVIDFSLAMNFALGKFQVFGYHMFNLVVHVFSAITLFQIFRITFSRHLQELKDKMLVPSFAFVATAIWALHPVQTESVTYIIQRSECLMGLFYLLTLYFLSRYAQPNSSGRWGIFAIFFCALGMATKEVMVTAPMVALIYDRIFLGTNFREIFRKRGWIYIGMALTWILLIHLTTVARVNDTNAGMSLPGVSPFTYMLAQQKVLARYLKIALWPNDLCFDYCWALPQKISEVFPFLLLNISLFVISAWMLFKKSAFGFWGIWFFIILAPTSSIFPIGDLAVEHRMYLPLAGIVWIFTMAIYKFCLSLPLTWQQKKTLVIMIGTVIITGFIMTTVARNRLYQDEEGLWRDTLRKGNETDRVHLNLGVALFRNGKIIEAKENFLKAAQFNSEDYKIYFNLGLVSLELNDFTPAEGYFARALELKSNFKEGYYMAGLAYFQKGKYSQAGHYFQKVVEIDPEHVIARFNLATVWANLGSYTKAVKEFEEVIRIDPMFPDAERRLRLIQSLISRQ